MLCRKFNVLPSQIDSEDHLEIKKLLTILEQELKQKEVVRKREEQKQKRKRPRRRR